MIFIGIISLLIPIVLEQGKNLSLLNTNSLNDKLNLLYTELNQYLLGFNISLNESILNLESLTKNSVEIIPSILNWIGSVLGSITIGILSVLFISFFLLKDGIYFEDSVVLLFPKKLKFMASTSDIRKGLCIRFNHDIYKIVEFLHVKPGKGPAFVRTKLKSVTNGKVVDNTFPSRHKIDEVKVITSQYQFLYNDTDYYYFMNNDDYNQITIEKTKIDYPDLLKEGENVTIIINTEDNNPLSVDMPLNVILEVTHTEPGVKGNTATNATKPAVLETGASVNVPLFINEGDKVKIDTEKGQYLERIK